jgi:CubicO group peptidase (beta-lactamase class C family)
MMAAAGRDSDGRLTDPRIEAAISRAIEMGEEGLKVAVYLGDELIIDSWAGFADPAAGRKVDAKTLFPVFSVSKALTATAVHVQAVRGFVEYDAPLAKYWPEFAQNGKGHVTIRHVLTHRAGLPQMPENTTPETMADWDLAVREIAALPLLWEAGSRNSYLAFTFGWLLGEIVVRTDPQRRSFGQFLQEEICGPLGIENFYIGLPEQERARVGILSAATFVRVGAETAPFNAAAIPPAVRPSPAVYNRPDVQAACIPAVNGIADAKSAARLFALLANHGTLNGVRLLPEDLVWSFTQLRDNPYQKDEVIGRAPLVGMGGFFVAGDYPPGEPVIGSNPHVLCQPGGGQTIAWADLDSRFSAAIVHNRMFGNIPPRPPEEHPFTEIGDAVRAVVADRLSA